MKTIKLTKVKPAHTNTITLALKHYVLISINSKVEADKVYSSIAHELYYRLTKSINGALLPKVSNFKFTYHEAVILKKSFLQFQDDFSTSVGTYELNTIELLKNQLDQQIKSL